MFLLPNLIDAPMYLTPTSLGDDLSNGFETMLLGRGFWLGSFWAWDAFGTGEILAGELFFESFYFGGLLAGSFWVGSFILGAYVHTPIYIARLDFQSKKNRMEHVKCMQRKLLSIE